MILFFFGYQFTWINNQEEPDTIGERLDRAVATRGWLDHFPKAQVKHLLTRASYHAALLLKVDWFGKFRHRPNKKFYFEAMWLKSLDCANLIQDSWTGDLGLQANTVNYKMGLIKWDKNIFANVKQQTRVLEAEISSLQTQPLTSAVRARLKTSKLDLETLLDKEEVMWKQMSNFQWLAEGDMNTCFFHSQATRRARRNEIKGLRDGTSVLVEDQVGMEHIVMDYYYGLFTSKDSATVDTDGVLETMGLKVDATLNTDLYRIFTPDEIKKLSLICIP